MSSQRLPGKMLAPLAGRPAIEWVLERLAHAQGVEKIVVATSVASSDDPVEEYCRRRDLAVHRGSLEDVAERLLGAAEAAGLDAFARVNGDSPLLDQRLVDRGVELMRASEADLVTNVRPRTFPPGESVEVVRTDALAAVVGTDRTQEEREHVTGPLYEGDFRVLRFEAPDPRTDVSYTLDTPEDHARLDAILRAMERPHWEYSWEEVLELP